MGTRKPIFTPLVALPVFWVVLFRATAFPSLGPLSAPNTTGKTHRNHSTKEPRAWEKGSGMGEGLRKVGFAGTSVWV